jgi:hypothetical protein
MKIVWTTVCPLFYTVPFSYIYEENEIHIRSSLAKYESQSEIAEVQEIMPINVLYSKLIPLLHIVIVYYYYIDFKYFRLMLTQSQLSLKHLFSFIFHFKLLPK